MKNLILLIALLFSVKATAQVIPGSQIDSCHKAYQLIPSATQVFTSFSFLYPTNPPHFFLPTCQDSVRDYREWFKFTTGSQPQIFRIGIKSLKCRVQLFKGNCNALEEVSCLNMVGNYDSNSEFFSLEVNTEYRLRVWNVSDGISISKISVQSILPGRKIHSTAVGGLWHLPATWQEGRVPIDGDSVYITDGSKVEVTNLAGPFPASFAYLQVGGNNPSSARLAFKYGFTTSFKGDVIIGQGDSLRDLNTGQGINLSFEKDLVVNGILETGLYSTRLGFTGHGKQKMRGTGSLPGYLNGFTINKSSDTVETNFQIGTYYLFLKDGVLKNNQPVRLINIFSIITHDSAKGIIQVTRAKITNSPVVGSPINLSNDKAFYSLNYFQNSIPPDTSMPVGKEFVLSSEPVTFSLSKNKGTHLRHNGNLHGKQTPFASGKYGTLKLRSQDTLKIHFTPRLVQGSLNSVQWYGNTPQEDSLYYLDGGITEIDSSFYDITNAPNSFLAGNVLMGKNGRRRMATIQGKWPSGRASGVKVWFQFIDQVPGGTPNAPLTFVGGSSMLKMTSNKPLPSNAQLTFWYFSNDVIIGNPGDIRIAQGPSPNGPWTSVSVEQSTTIPHPVGTEAQYKITNTNLDLANGSYFCLASVANVQDAQIVDIIAPPRWKAGCGNPLRIGAVIRNNGVFPITQINLIAKNINSGAQAFGSYTLGTPTLATKTDTVWIENGLAIDFLDNTTIRVKLLLSDDANSANDSLQKAFNYTPAAMPYQEQFSTYSTFYQQGGTGNKLLLPTGWWANAEYVIGTSFQSWDGYLNYLHASREPNITQPLLAHSPYINAPAGTYKISYAYKWATLDNPVAPKPADTLTFSYSTDCGVAFVPVDVVNRDNHPSPPPAGWISRSAIFTKADNDPIFLQVRLVLPVGSGGLRVDVDSIRISAITANEALVHQSRQISVYPNPNNGKFLLDLPGKGGRVRILDLQGREVWNEKVLPDQSQAVLNLEKRPVKGLYIVQWENGSMTGQAKVILE